MHHEAFPLDDKLCIALRGRKRCPLGTTRVQRGITEINYAIAEKTLNCPTCFRAAWTDYLQLEAKIHVNDLLHPSIPLLTIGLPTKPSTIFNHGLALHLFGEVVETVTALKKSKYSIKPFHLALVQIVLAQRCLLGRRGCCLAP